MFRMPIRLFLALALLGTSLVLYGVTQAQEVTTDLAPMANDVPLDAFEARPTLAAPGTETVVRETKPRAAPAPFTDMMLGWEVDEPDGSALLLEVRVSTDGTTWTDWVVTEPDERIENATLWSNIFYVDLARFYQVRMTLHPNAMGNLPELSNLQVHTLYVEDVPLAAPPVTLATTPGMDLASASMPAYVSRTAWGNPDGESAPHAPPKFRTATHLVVHHTADANTLSSREPNWASRVRAIWAYHANTLGWGDIGYNWLIDPNGVIYAGRAGSTRLDADAVGFHDTANYGSMGVSVIGNYMAVQPTAAAQASLVNLLAWKAAQRGIDVQSKSFYYGCSISRYCSPYNSGSIVPNLVGHRQVMPGQTACPGDAFFSILPTIRQRVADRTKSLPPPRPDNGDLTIDNSEAGFTWTGELFEAACGISNHTNWSWASNEADGITNDLIGVWRPTIPISGQYKVLAHIPSCSTVTNLTTNARYEIGHSTGKSNVTVNQQTQRGWVDLGTFTFSTGTGSYVQLTDLTSESFYDKGVIMFDAIQWVPVAQPTPSPLTCALNASLRTNGSIDLSITCPSATATQFEVQVRDTGNGQTRTIHTFERRLTFFGTPGHTYEFRLRASDGTTAGPFSASPEATLRVPTNASFTRILVPRVGD